MRIARDLPQFEDSTALFIVASAHGAHFYLAHQGAVQELDSFKVQNPRYSDREGFFAKRGQGMMLGSGAVYEFPKEKVRTDFLRELAQRARGLATRINVAEVYVFAPSERIRDVLGRLPRQLAEKVVFAFRRNLFGRHPFEALRAVRAERSAKSKEAKLAIKPEARKILERTEQA